MSRVLITGGTEGIGKAFAQWYASIGYDLVIAARTFGKLVDVKNEIESAYGVHVDIEVCDLGVVGSAKGLYEKVKDKDIGVVINNAGIGYTACCWDIDIAKEENMVVLNDVSMMSLTKLFLKEMKEKHCGTIINVSSTGAFQPGPYIAGYYASKAFVLSYTEAVHEEALKYGVRVYCVAPGPVKTSFYQKSGAKVPHSALGCEDVVLYTMRHMKKQCVIVPGRMNRLLRIIPKRMKMYIVGKMKYRALRKK